MATSRRGQALVELAVGLLAVALVLTGVLTLSRFIIASLDGQRTVRADAGRRALGGTAGTGEAYASAEAVTTLTVSPPASDAFFGGRTRLEVREAVHLPVTGL